MQAHEARAPRGGGRIGVTRMLILTVGAAALLTPAGQLAAQGPGVFEIFGARSSSTRDPVFGGLALSGYSGPFGIRLGGALNLTRYDSTVTTPLGIQRCTSQGCSRYYQEELHGVRLSGWSADADLVFAPLRSIPSGKVLFLGFAPYAFLGFGGYGFSPVQHVDTARTALSYGGGLYHEIAGWLGLSGEARYRRFLGNNESYEHSGAWEYKLGLSASFGSTNRVRRPTAEPRRVYVSAGEAAPVIAPQSRYVETVDEATRTRRANRLLDVAGALVESPWRRGGASPVSGFDAAGFVQYALAEQGIRVPRTARGISLLGEEIPARIGSLRPGDLLFFANSGSRIEHVAIYVGRERIIHATVSGGGVRYDVLGEGSRGQWFADHLVSARRILSAPTRTARPAPSWVTRSIDDADFDPPDRAPAPRRSFER
jgi:cell wall-associated NlpC family hydrolase